MLSLRLLMNMVQRELAKQQLRGNDAQVIQFLNGLLALNQKYYFRFIADFRKEEARQLRSGAVATSDGPVHSMVRLVKLSLNITTVPLMSGTYYL